MHNDLSLRDQFALAAMQHVNWSLDDLQGVAAACYMIADAMLAARETQPTGDAPCEKP